MKLKNNKTLKNTVLCNGKVITIIFNNVVETLLRNDKMNSMLRNIYYSKHYMK